MLITSAKSVMSPDSGDRKGHNPITLLGGYGERRAFGWCSIGQYDSVLFQHDFVMLEPLLQEIAQVGRSVREFIRIAIRLSQVVANVLRVSGKPS
jgi:hypothetical protein